MKKYFLIIVLLGVSYSIFSQTNIPESPKKFKIGFSLGTNYSLLKNKGVMPVSHTIDNGFGMQFGIFMDYQPKSFLIISPKIELGLNHANIITNLDLNQINYQVYQNSIDMMLHVQYQFGKGKYVPYIFAGPHLKMPLYVAGYTNTQYVTAPNFAIDFGFGVECKFKYFTIAPELRYSLGLSNVNQNPYYTNFKYNQVSFAIKFKP